MKKAESTKDKGCNLLWYYVSMVEKNRKVCYNSRNYVKGVKIC